MRADRFDDLTRRLANVASLSGSRRSLLQALGLGGAAASLGPALASVGPAGSPHPSRTRAQAVPSNPIEDLAFELDYDIDRIFRFVRDEVVYDPYAGVLRGGKGTLWGLAGNAADQAVLLKELLDAALVPTRYVVGELTDAGAAGLLVAAALDGAAQLARNDRLLVQRPGASDGGQVAPPADPELDEQIRVFAERVVGDIDGLTAAGIETVAEALGQAGIALSAPSAEIPEAERRQHVWVQYASGTDWVDLDPSAPGAGPGDVFAERGTPVEALPDELVHRVSVSVVAEQVSGDGTVRRDLLTFEAPSSALLDVPISLMHPTPDALQGLGVSIGSLIEGFTNYVPTLIVGETVTHGESVTFGTGGGLLDAFGGEAAEGDTLAEWLEVTVTSPSGSSTATRTLFDRVGEEARATGPIDVASIPPADLDGGDPDAGFLALAGFWMLAVVGGVVPRSALPQTFSDEIVPEDVLPALHAYHYACEVQATRTAALGGSRLYHDAPNVTAFVQRQAAGATDPAGATIAIDLLHRSSKTAPGSVAGELHPMVAAGVVRHAVEHGMLQAGAMEPLALLEGSPASVLRVFGEARVQGIETLVLLPGDDSVELPPVAAGPRRLMEEALAAGRIVIVPERAVALDGRERLGWWLVDPATGVTVDQMDDGSGGVLTEYAFEIKMALCTVMFAIVGAMAGEVISQAAAGISTGGAIARSVLVGGGAGIAGAACGM